MELKTALEILVALIQLYCISGLLFAVYFFVKGAAQIDPLIKESKWSIKLLFLPGAVLLWPVLLKKLIRK
jgi:hypothetical protein